MSKSNHLRPHDWLWPGWLSLLLGALLFLGCERPSETREAASTPVGDESNVSPVGTLAPGEPLTSLSIEADDAVWGSGQADVTLVAFLDFQCRFCAEGFATLRKLRDKYQKDELRIVFKHLPLEFHEFAVPAAVVGQVVNQHAGSTAFFEFANQAFTEQSQLSFEKLAAWAEAAGVDRATYNQHVSKTATLERIIQDVSVAQRLGVEATPTFFVNGRVIGGAQPVELFEKTIHEELLWMQAKKEDAWAQRYRSRVTQNLRASLAETLLEQDPYDYRVPVDGSPSWGAADALVTVVVFSDYECPFCKRADTTLDQVRRNYSADVRVVFKHLPLDFHERARPAALLASAVQTKSGNEAFFGVSHELFKSSPQLDDTLLTELGIKYGLSRQEAQSAISGQTQAAVERLRRDGYLAEDVGAEGTPHFFINGKRMSGARPYEHLSALIDHELIRASKLVENGTAKGDVYAALQRDAKSPGAPELVEQEIPSEGRPTRGAPGAPVTVHLFSDFECPYCRQVEVTLTDLVAQNPGTLEVVWHDFPLPFHKRARPLAEVAQAAYELHGNRGFWSVHDAIFALDRESPRLEGDELAQALKQDQLDWDRLAARAKAQPAASIEADLSLAQELGISGTPAMVIGKYVVKGARSLEYLQRVLEMNLDPPPSPKPLAHPSPPH